jgi:hypothetical protein
MSFTSYRNFNSPKRCYFGLIYNYAANMIFQQSGAIIKTIPIDEQGLDVD